MSPRKFPDGLTDFEQTLISFYKPDMISYINTHPAAFEEAMALALTDKQPFSWRAAWVLFDCIQENDLRARKYLKKIVAYLPKSGKSQQRELMKILMAMRIPDSLAGAAFDIAVDFWKDVTKDASVRHTAFRMIVKLAEQYPELEHEVLLLLHDHYFSTLSPGVKKSILKMIQAKKKSTTKRSR